MIATKYTLTPEQVQGIEYAFELALNDQECYIDDGKPELDYTTIEDRTSKLAWLLNIRNAAEGLGMPIMAERARDLHDAFAEAFSVSK